MPTTIVEAPLPAAACWVAGFVLGRPVILLDERLPGDCRIQAITAAQADLDARQGRHLGAARSNN